MDKYVDVEIGKKKFTVQYNAQALMNAPLEIAARAIEQEESLWLLDFKKVDVMQQVGVIFATDFVPVQTLSEYSGLRLEEGPEFEAPNLYHWQFELLCDECEGAGYTTTAKGREIDCPCCGGNGATFHFSIFTDSDGVFKSFPPRPVWKSAGSDFRDYNFVALPIDEAQEAVRNL